MTTNDPTRVTLSDSIDVRRTSSLTCYICLENIVTEHKQFGLQNNCNHFFCFDCLSAWRRQRVSDCALHSNAVLVERRVCHVFQNIGTDKTSAGRCPLCRTRSTFIAPSWRCFSDSDDKRALIDAHKSRLKTLPCRAFSHYGHCRFGHRCYYSHRLPSHFNGHRFDVSSSFAWNSSHSSDEQNYNERQTQRRISSNAHRYRPY